MTTVFKIDFKDIDGLYEVCEKYQYIIKEKNENFLIFLDNPFKELKSTSKNRYKDFFEYISKYLQDWQIKSIKRKIDNFEISMKDVEYSIGNALCFGLDNYKGKQILNNIY